MIHNQNIKELSNILGTININGDYSSDEVSDSYNNVIREGNANIYTYEPSYYIRREKGIVNLRLLISLKVF